MKTFVLDTNVLLHDPNSIFSFKENEVVLPIYVIEEIDNFKKDMSELGRNAREVARKLDKLREKGELRKGVVLDNGGSLRIGFSKRGLPPEFITDRKADNNILSTALQVFEENQANSETHRTTFVTKDVNLRIRAHAMGIPVEDFDTERQDISELYSGYGEVTLPGDTIDTFYQQGSIQMEGIKPPQDGFAPNEYLIIRNAEKNSHTALGRCNLPANRIEQLRKTKGSIWGIRPRNKEQTFALDVLMDESIPLVTLVGKAGTGKTLLAVAAGLQLVVEEHKYHRLLISRPVIPMGRDLGYLPGDIEEKLQPWMQPIYDNIEFLATLDKNAAEPEDNGNKKAGKGNPSGYLDDLFDEGVVQIEPLTYIRGRSIPNQFMIVDEAQNLTPHEIKTILTRAGDNTKIIFTGDPYQIDNPYVDSVNNGLVHLVNRFRMEQLAGHVTLFKGERSDLAELAATIL
jgi:PhoH-like ATPase